MRGTLSATMTLREFENDYSYRKQLKDFAGSNRNLPSVVLQCDLIRHSADSDTGRT
jgi:hypothetical protein